MVIKILEFIKLKKKTNHAEIARYFGLTTGQIEPIIHWLTLKGWVQCLPQKMCHGCPTSCHGQWVIMPQDNQHV
ncbi:MAG: FeoC-like transcriptional regulator [Candidatus Comchoanobacterales bacterium]